MPTDRKAPITSGSVLILRAPARGGVAWAAEECLIGILALNEDYINWLGWKNGAFAGLSEVHDDLSFLEFWCADMVDWYPEEALLEEMQSVDPMLAELVRQEDVVLRKTPYFTHVPKLKHDAAFLQVAAEGELCFMVDFDEDREEQEAVQGEYQTRVFKLEGEEYPLSVKEEA